MGKQHDGSGGAFTLQVVGEPGKLFGTQSAQSSGLQICHIDEADKMHAILVK